MPSDDELYFCLYLTSSEHEIVGYELEKLARAHGVRPHYYRELKDGHVPMHREAKYSGPRAALNRFKAAVRAAGYDAHVVPNPHTVPA